MKRIASIFIALSLCTLPCFAETKTTLTKEMLLKKHCNTPNRGNYYGTVSCKGNDITIACNSNKSSNTPNYPANLYDYSKICPKGNNNISYTIKITDNKEVTNAKDKNTTESKTILTKDTLLSNHCQKPKTGNHYGTVSCKGNDITIACNSNKSSNTPNYPANLYDYSKICPKGNDKISYTIKITGNDDLTTQDVKKIAKEKAPEIVCEKNDKGKYGTVTALCANNKITINCAGKKSSDPIADKIRQNIIKGICPNATADNNFKLEINESKEVTKEAATKTQAENCATGGNGTWNDKKDKCNCNSGYVLDNDGKCVTETTAFKNAKENLESLGTALTNALNKIKAAEESKQ